MIEELKTIFRRELARMDELSKSGKMESADYANLDRLCSALKKLIETDVGEGDEIYASTDTADLKKLLASLKDD